MGDGMLKDQPFNQVKSSASMTLPEYLDHLNKEPDPENTGLQDGMLAYYHSQLKFTDAHDDNRLAREYFDCRDMLGTAKK